VVILTNNTPQSTQTNNEPTILSVPRRLELGNKSKGSPPPADTSKSTGDKDKHHKQEDGNVPGSSLSEADQKMDAVYGGHVHQNLGTHLTGGIVDDALLWQERW
jgi:hypothetical protein